MIIALLSVYQDKLLKLLERVKIDLIPLNTPLIVGNEWQYIKDCLNTNWVSSVGSYVDRFEEEFAKFLGVKKAIATINGTGALTLALKVVGIQPGHEVIIPSLTFVATANAIKYFGAEPVFVDVIRDTCVINENLIENLISDKTRAIMPVHLYGQPSNMEKINSIARKYNLFVIEDATESLGSIYNGSHTGTLGDIGCFSFNGNKIITTGAGGMLVTNNENFGDFAKHLSSQARTILENGGFYHDEIGYNFRMPNLLAAMGVAQLENLNHFINIKIKNAKLYRTLLSNIPGISFIKDADGVNNVNWLFSILIEKNFPLSRDELIKKLNENGIQSRPFFYPLHKMKPFIKSRTTNMTITNELYNIGINLPSSVSLRDEDIVQICNVIAHQANIS